MAINLLAILFFPGVVIHELGHFLAAAMLMVPVGEMEFIPKITESYVKLGSVAVGKTDPIRHALIGVAPVVIGSIVMFGSLFYFTQAHTFEFLDAGWKWIVLFYIVFQIGNTMFSSRKDVEGAFELLIAFGLIFIALYILGLRLPAIFLDQLNSSKLYYFMSTIDLFLLVPITVDGIIYAVVRAIIRR